MDVTPSFSIVVIALLCGVVAVLIANRRWGKVLLVAIGVAFLFAFLTAFVSFRHSASIPPRDRGHGFVIDHRGKVRISREIDEVFAQEFDSKSRPATRSQRRTAPPRRPRRPICHNRRSSLRCRTR